MHAMLPLGSLLVDKGANRENLDVVDVVEVVAQIQLVEFEGDGEGRQVWWLLWQWPEKGNHMVRTTQGEKEILLV